MITDFNSMLTELKDLALTVTNVTHSTHIGSGESMISRLQKFYEGTFNPTVEIAIFIDSSEGLLEDDDSSNPRITFDLGFTALKKAKLSEHQNIDLAWNDTVNALVEFIGKIKHLQENVEDDTEILVNNKFAQVGKVVNSDVWGWRADAKVTFPINHIYCNH
jgi:hypothetical protein